MRPIPSIVLGAVVFALCSGAVLAQTMDEPDVDYDPDTLVTTDECEVTPLGESEPSPSTAETLSETLAQCDGVLAPVPIGDAEMTIVPPPVGETPMIDPEDVPP